MRQNCFIFALLTLFHISCLRSEEIVYTTTVAQSASEDANIDPDYNATGSTDEAKVKIKFFQEFFLYNEFQKNYVYFNTGN
jgi:hypothetical protein